MPAPARIVALGDLHGDLDATRAALALAGAIDDEGRWAGGATTVVQTGDQLDRCGEQVWRIDVGLSKVYGGNPEVLEIAGDAVRVIKRK